MKIGWDADYNVRVTAHEWGEPPDQALLYEGIWSFELNQVVEVAFVPDPAAPRPWSLDGLPADLSALTSTRQARLLTLLATQYAVTPDEARAGSAEQFDWPFDWDDTWPGSAPPRPTVFYVTSPEFATYLADLDALSDIAGNVHSTVRRARVMNHPVVRFVESRILGSPLLDWRSARAVGR